LLYNTDTTPASDDPGTSEKAGDVVNESRKQKSFSRVQRQSFGGRPGQKHSEWRTGAPEAEQVLVTDLKRQFLLKY